MAGRLYTTTEAADILRTSVPTVRNLITTGRLGSVRLGRQWRIPEEALAALIGDHDADPADVAARETVERSRALGRLPDEVPAEVLGHIAAIIQDHYRDQADRNSA
jgi:excisionase family DNA binding protein